MYMEEGVFCSIWLNMHQPGEIKEKLEVDLTPNCHLSSFAWWPTSFCHAPVLSRMPANNKFGWKEIYCMFAQKAGWNLAALMYYRIMYGNIHLLWVNLWTVFMYCYTSICALLELWMHKSLYTVVNMGGGMGQGPATELTHLRLN